MILKILTSLISHLCCLLFAGTLLNTLSSVLSYNSFKFSSLRDHEDSWRLQHQPSLAKQGVYCIIFVVLNLWYYSHSTEN